MTAPYNTPAGILTYLTDLKGLNLLAEDRRAAQKRGEPLEDFYILGYWYFGSYGQVSPLGDRHHKAPAELVERCPPVMTVEQIDLFMRDDTLVRVSDWPFPPEFEACSVCGQKWTIDNARDFVHHENSREIAIEPFVGERLSSITKVPELTRVKAHFVAHDMIYNDRHPEGSKFREARNGNLWRYVDKDYVVQPGDRASVRVMSFTHRACHQRVQELETRTEFVEAFAKAGYPWVNLITKKNGYDGEGTPWYSAQIAGSPPFTIGWRRSVINLSWEETGIRLPDLFEGEDVTRDAHCIHAHGYAKLTQYLAKLLPALGASP